jgi:hypothetical protein
LFGFNLGLQVELLKAKWDERRRLQEERSLLLAQLESSIQDRGTLDQVTMIMDNLSARNLSASMRDVNRFQPVHPTHRTSYSQNEVEGD